MPTCAVMPSQIDESLPLSQRAMSEHSSQCSFGGGAPFITAAGAASRQSSQRQADGEDHIEACERQDDPDLDDSMPLLDVSPPPPHAASAANGIHSRHEGAAHVRVRVPSVNGADRGGRRRLKRLWISFQRCCACAESPFRSSPIFWPSWRRGSGEVTDSLGLGRCTLPPVVWIPPTLRGGLRFFLTPSSPLLATCPACF